MDVGRSVGPIMRIPESCLDKERILEIHLDSVAWGEGGLRCASYCANVHVNFTRMATVIANRMGRGTPPQ